MQHCIYGGQIWGVGVLSTWLLGNQAQVVSLGGRCLYLLSHLPSLVDIISNSTWLIRDSLLGTWLQSGRAHSVRTLALDNLPPLKNRFSRVLGMADECSFTHNVIMLSSKVMP